MSDMQDERRRSAYADTMEALRQAESALPDFTTDYNGQIASLYERIVNRPAFRYDPGTDPLYQSYRTRMVTEGSRAMRDTMGQAAALTGGYGSSYAESVGQQQYGLYLEKLGQAMPELYKAAYERYRNDGDALYQQLDAARGLADARYGREADRFGLAAQLEQQQYERGENSYRKLVELISQTGYEPEQEELIRTGLTRAQAEALRDEYLRKNPRGGGGGGSSGGFTSKTTASKPGAKESVKLAANQPGSGNSGKTRRL